MCYSVTHVVTSSQPPRIEQSPRDAYLDAARACILDVGWRRTTLTEVARRAGVSRMTIYRTWSDMPELLGDLMTREWGELVASTQPTLGADGTDGPGPGQIADGVLRAVTVLRDNELFVRIVELDPELILPYLLARRGRSQELILGLLAAVIEAGQKAGTVRAGNPDGARPRRRARGARVRPVRPHDGRRRRHRRRARRGAAAPRHPLPDSRR